MLNGYIQQHELIPEADPSHVVGVSLEFMSVDDG